MNKLNIQRFAPKPGQIMCPNFSGTIDYTLYGTYEPPKNFHSLKVGEDLSGKEIMIIFCKRFCYTVFNAHEGTGVSSEPPFYENFGYKIALDETSFGLSNNTIFLQPASLVSYGESLYGGEGSYSLTLFKSAKHSINAITAANTKVFNISYKEGSDGSYNPYNDPKAEGVMDNLHYVVATRYTLPADFGVVTEIAPRNWASNIYVKNDDFKIGNKKIESLKINNKDIVEISQEGKINGYYEKMRQLEFADAPEYQWLHIEYPKEKINGRYYAMDRIPQPSLVNFSKGGTVIDYDCFPHETAESTQWNDFRMKNTITITGEGRHGPSDEHTTLYQCDVLCSQAIDSDQETIKATEEYFRFTDVIVDKNADGRIVSTGINAYMPKDRPVSFSLDDYRTKKSSYTEVSLSKTDNCAEGLLLKFNFPSNIDKLIFPSYSEDIKTLFSAEASYTVTPTSEGDDGSRYYNYAISAALEGTWDEASMTMKAPYYLVIGDLNNMYGEIIYRKEWNTNKEPEIKTDSMITNLPYDAETAVSAPLTNLDTSSPMYPYVKKITWNDTNN